MSVTAIIVTRGDVDLTQIIDSLPKEYEVLVWDNGVPSLKVPGVCEYTLPSIKDLAVYGRYAAIKHASNDLIYVQDDDVLHHPEGIKTMVRAWYESKDVAANDPRALWHESPDNLREISAGRHVVCNMPANFRHAFYQEHALVGFGAVFHRDAPRRAFERMAKGTVSVRMPGQTSLDEEYAFNRTCDIVFTALTPRILTDVLYEDMPWASADNRMWKQPTHREERQRMLDLVLEVRDARS